MPLPAGLRQQGFLPSIKTIMTKTNPSTKPKSGPNPYIHGKHLQESFKNIPAIGGAPAFLQDGPNFTGLGALNAFVQLVKKSDVLPYQITFETGLGLNRAFPRIVNGVTRYRTAKVNRASADARDLARLLPRLGLLKDAQTKLWVYPPHLELLSELYANHPISESLLDRPNFPFLDRLEGEIYNDFVDVVRREMRANNGLRRKGHNWNFGGEEGLDSLHVYLDEKFETSPNLTIVHLNLFSTMCWTGVQDASPQVQKQLVDAVRAMRNDVVDCARRNTALFGHRRGLIWSIMPSLDAGYYLHLTLLFDTDGLINAKMLNGTIDTPLAQVHLPMVERTDVTFPQLLGDYLVAIGTKGQGTYTVCHHDPIRYGSEWIHGPVLATDGARRADLYKALGHLAQRRQLVRLKGEPRGKYFGKSW